MKIDCNSCDINKSINYKTIFAPLEVLYFFLVQKCALSPSTLLSFQILNFPTNFMADSPIQIYFCSRHTFLHFRLNDINGKQIMEYLFTVVNYFQLFQDPAVLEAIRSQQQSQKPEDYLYQIPPQHTASQVVRLNTANNSFHIECMLLPFE